MSDRSSGIEDNPTDELIHIVDTTGAVMGGARRFLDHLEAYALQSRRRVVLLGREGASISAPWLLSREQQAAMHRASHRIALNNLSFATGSRRTVLMRNALHFLTPTEEEEIGHLVPQRVRRAAGLVKLLGSRATRIVVPTTAMLERLLCSKPGWAPKCEVRHHPLSPSHLPHRAHSDRFVLLCAVLPAPYKQLDKMLPPLVAAASRFDDMQLQFTMSTKDALNLGLAESPNVCFLGQLDTRSASEAIAGADALVMPNPIESFGYGLAEARLANIPVLAHASLKPLEVAGRSAIETTFEDQDELSSALEAVIGWTPDGVVEENPFDPTSYFEDLFSSD